MLCNRASGMFRDQQVKKLEDLNQSLKDKLSSSETEQETILSAIETEINAACLVLSRNALEKFKPVPSVAHLRDDPHYWLAETKTKLNWLCEELRERDERERTIRTRHQQCREQLQEHKLRKETQKDEQQHQISRLEQQLEEAHRDKKELLDKTRRRDEEMWLLQDRVVDLERSTRMALDHLESVPEKLNLLDDMKDLNDSSLQREVMEERYAQYREIVGSLQQQLEDSKRRIQEYREEKFKADVQSARLSALSASLRGNGSFLSSSQRSDTNYSGCAVGQYRCLTTAECYAYNHPTIFPAHLCPSMVTDVILTSPGIPPASVHNNKPRSLADSRSGDRPLGKQGHCAYKPVSTADRYMLTSA